jgi:hypothetical protein
VHVRPQAAAIREHKLASDRGPAWGLCMAKGSVQEK